MDKNDLIVVHDADGVSMVSKTLALKVFATEDGSTPSTPAEHDRQQAIADYESAYARLMAAQARLDEMKIRYADGLAIGQRFIVNGSQTLIPVE